MTQPPWYGGVPPRGPLPPPLPSAYPPGYPPPPSPATPAPSPPAPRTSRITSARRRRADAQQLVTVEAGSTETSYATARIWQRVDGCWASAGGPFGKATSGCISLRRAALLRVLRWLSPTAEPRIVIGTHADLLG